MAAIYAKDQKLNDCLVLNSKGRIADATTANIFLIRKSKIISPPLEEGPVSGVMRKHIIQFLNVKSSDFELKEEPIEVNDLLEADEIFLSNAIYGIRWVREFEGRSYSNDQTLEIYRQLFQTIPH